MSNIRLYYPGAIVENSINLLSKEHTHYLTNVMRLKRGSNVNLFNKDIIFILCLSSSEYIVVCFIFIIEFINFLIYT